MPSKPVDDKTPLEEAPKKKPTMLIIAFFLCFIFSVGASSGVTYFLLQPSEEDSQFAEKITEQSSQLSNVEQTLSQQDAKIKAIEEQNDVLKLYLRHSSATALKNILVDQEQNIQAYLKVMKSAMRDLSTLSPRTTDWNDEYQYQLDLALKGSLEREDLLKLLKTGEPNEKN
ncbi:hypothetical protein EBI01_19325 [Marinomonas rhizomae]|uniref:Uncharacterized protein n=1 Tax=Marinomonas rhizomae TaxID=491948 RepID=A0A366ITB6_9GAMM|nr:hypothetical protein [Marinomonas rhizomae]RBP78026.1 hypothetical protein DFP80_12210 [Marinomonas rhizomae]RNF69248.1 hypothetical protein EBI01_19325 [Marinomonas rhizomae]